MFGTSLEAEQCSCVSSTTKRFKKNDGEGAAALECKRPSNPTQTPTIPIPLMLDHVSQFLNRSTWNNLSLTNQEAYSLTMAPNTVNHHSYHHHPPWPNQNFVLSKPRPNNRTTRLQEMKLSQSLPAPSPTVGYNSDFIAGSGEYILLHWDDEEIDVIHRTTGKWMNIPFDDELAAVALHPTRRNTLLICGGLNNRRGIKILDDIRTSDCVVKAEETLQQRHQRRQRLKFRSIDLGSVIGSHYSEVDPICVAPDGRRIATVVSNKTLPEPRQCVFVASINKDVTHVTAIETHWFVASNIYMKEVSFHPCFQHDEKYFLIAVGQKRNPDRRVQITLMVWDLGRQVRGDDIANNGSSETGIRTPILEVSHLGIHCGTNRPYAIGITQYESDGQNCDGVSRTHWMQARKTVSIPLLATASQDGKSIRIWNLYTSNAEHDSLGMARAGSCACIGTIPVTTAAVDSPARWIDSSVVIRFCMAFSPNGKLFAIGYPSGMIEFWNIKYDFCATKNGDGVAAACAGATARTMKLTTRIRRVATLPCPACYTTSDRYNTWIGLCFTGTIGDTIVTADRKSGEVWFQQVPLAAMQSCLDSDGLAS